MLKFRNKILGMNARSTIYLKANKRKARQIADEKLMTKQCLRQHGLPTAELVAVVRTRNEALTFDWDSLPPSFVVKPNRGFGGEGILVIFNRLKNGNWLTTNKMQFSNADLTLHVLNILDGNYSLTNTPDSALFETRLAIDPLFKRFSSEGIPDIRIVVYNGVPIMAMLRVPTQKSSGKANLAQGGVGIGIDVPTGLTTHAITKSFFYEKEIDRHPDNNYQIRGVKIPYWPDILKTSILAAKAVGLRFAGVDISVDKKRGPVVLEVNARPGLGIQVASMSPLRERLERIRDLKVESVEHGIALARELFAGYFEAEIATITGRQIIGLIEPVTLYGKDKIHKKIRAKIDTGADRSSIDISLARELGYNDAVEKFLALDIPTKISKEDLEILRKKYADDITRHNDISALTAIRSSHGHSLRILIPITVSLAGYRMNVEATVVDRSHLYYPMLIGRRNLSHFLIDTTKVLLKKKTVPEKKL